jgi:hypothetical protein
VSKYKLYRLQPEDVTQAELFTAAERERDIARTVFRTWPVAACLPYTQEDGPEAGAVILTIWETTDDAKAKRAPVALVRTQPNNVGFKQQLWATPVSA